MDELQKIKEAIFRMVPLPGDEWDEFASKLVIKHFSKADYLIRGGEVENYIYFLNKGATRNYFIKDGKEFTVDFQFEGDFVTAYFSLITREPGSVFIQLLEDAEVVVIRYQTLLEFYEKSRHGERIGRLMAEFQYVRRLRKEMEFLSQTAEERYAGLMKKNPRLVSTVSVKHLSSYLGIQPESLSRIRKQYIKS